MSLYLSPNRIANIPGKECVSLSLFLCCLEKVVRVFSTHGASIATVFKTRHRCHSSSLVKRFYFLLFLSVTTFISKAVAMSGTRKLLPVFGSLRRFSVASRPWIGGTCVCLLDCHVPSSAFLVARWPENQYKYTTKLWFSGGGGSGDSELDKSTQSSKDVDISTSVIASASETSHLPFRQHGYRSVPFSWQELQQIVVKDKDLSRLSRSVDTEERYARDRQSLLKEYETLYDHILYSKFQLPRTRHALSGKWKVDTTTAALSTDHPQFNNNDVALVKNDYPYFVQDGIEHWVLWKLHANITSDDVDQALSDLRSTYGKDDIVDCIWWENPPSLKSLPDINHIHILVRRMCNL
jgi:Protein of unknown function (DUF3605)